MTTSDKLNALAQQLTDEDITFADAYVSHGNMMKAAKKAYPNDSKNLQLDICQGSEALHKMSHLSEKFDIVLIDSMNEFTSRFEAIKILKNKVSEDGILVLDNSDGPVNWKAASEMQNVKFERFSGYAYNCPVVCQTTIWQGSDIVHIKS